MKIWICTDIFVRRTPFISKFGSCKMPVLFQSIMLLDPNNRDSRIRTLFYAVHNSLNTNKLNSKMLSIKLKGQSKRQKKQQLEPSRKELKMKNGNKNN